MRPISTPRRGWAPPCLCGLLLVSVAATTPGIAAQAPSGEPDRSPPFYGFAYGQYRTGQSPDLGRHPTRAEIAEDLRHIRGVTDRVRLYGLAGSGRLVVEEASKLGFSILAGIWISYDEVGNEREVQAAIDLARADLPGIEALIVGNEVLLREELTADSLTAILRRVRRETGFPIAYAETAHIWSEGGADVQRLADAADMLLVHVYPFWDGVPIARAEAHYEATLDEVRRRYPGKPLAVGETGWPAAGPMVGEAVPSPESQARWLRYTLDRAYQDRIYYFSAYSEWWKDEGGVGAHWGVITSEGTLRPPNRAVLAERGVALVDWVRPEGAPAPGDTPLAMWDLYNREAHAALVAAASAIIARDSTEARLQEESPRPVIEATPQLDAVALAHYLRGCASESLDRVGDAVRDHETVVERYRKARARDPAKGPWFVWQAAARRLSAIRAGRLGCPRD